MKYSTLSIGIAAWVLSAAAVASAEYDFSYTFSEPPPPNSDSYRTYSGHVYTVFGTFWGQASGDLITNLSNVFLSAKDNGALIINDQAVTPLNYVGNPAATLSFSGAGDNLYLYFSGTTQMNGIQFWALSAATIGNLYGPGVDLYEADILPTAVGGMGSINYDRIKEPGSWSVQPAGTIAAVPEPGTCALMGLGIVALWANTRKKIVRNQTFQAVPA